MRRWHSFKEQIWRKFERKKAYFWSCFSTFYFLLLLTSANVVYMNWNFLRNFFSTSSIWYWKIVIIANFCSCDTPSKNDFSEIFSFSSQIYPLKITLCYKPDAIFLDGNFHVNFKNLIGFALAIWEGDEPAPYSKTGKMLIIQNKGLVSIPQFPWTLELGF